MRAAHKNLKGGDFLGRHIVAEFFEANFDALNDAPKLEAAMNEAALASGATILSSHQHFFEPHGVSCVVIIQESNLCIHTCLSLATPLQISSPVVSTPSRGSRSNS